MSRNDQVSISSGTSLTELTSDDATNVTLKNVGANVFTLYGSVGSVEPNPAVDGLGLPVLPGEGLVGYALSDIFPGISGVNRLWAQSKYDEAVAFVSHD